MSAKPKFALIPIAGLVAHERADERAVARLVREIETKKVFVDPIWVDRATGTILNGHHRYRAAKRLGARRIPAYLFEYLDDPSISLDRWAPGPPIRKEEVLAAAREGRLFPVKTTRHRLRESPPPRPIPLVELLRIEDRGRSAGARSAARRARPHR